MLLLRQRNLKSDSCPAGFLLFTIKIPSRSCPIINFIKLFIRSINYLLYKNVLYLKSCFSDRHDDCLLELQFFTLEFRISDWNSGISFFLVVECDVKDPYGLVIDK